ncbi:hypothetical protein P9112_013524 [Eukaryota sp. TZLM1-RC]
MNLLNTILILSTLSISVSAFRQCSSVDSYQYQCEPPHLSNSTYQPINCQRGNFYLTNCTVFDAVHCDGSRTFEVSFPCRYAHSKSYFRALGFSIFSGIFGGDRLYLGYPTLAVMKLVTFGGFVIGTFIDFILVVLQIVIPSDGTAYNNAPIYQRINRIRPSNMIFLE